MLGRALPPSNAYSVTVPAGLKALDGRVYRAGDEGSVTRDSAIHRHLREQGFRWDGEIAGSQKDFMHFSPSGG